MQDDRLHTSLPHALVRLFRLVNRAHNRAFKPLGMSAEQAHVLEVLWAVGPMTMGQLQRLLALSSPTLTGTIDRMAQQGLVRRVASEADRRVIVLEPMPATAPRRKKLDAISDATEHACFGTLSVADRRELLRLLHAATAALERDD